MYQYCVKEKTASSIYCQVNEAWNGLFTNIHTYVRAHTHARTHTHTCAYIYYKMPLSLTTEAARVPISRLAYLPSRLAHAHHCRRILTSGHRQQHVHFGFTLILTGNMSPHQHTCTMYHWWLSFRFRFREHLLSHQLFVDWFQFRFYALAPWCHT